MLKAWFSHVVDLPTTQSLVSSENVGRFVPVDPRCICDGSSTYWWRHIYAIFNHSICKVWNFESCYVIRCVCRWSRWSHKIFSSPTIADNRRLPCEVELGSTSQASRRSMPRTEHNSAIGVHICCKVYRRDMRTRLKQRVVTLLKWVLVYLQS